MSGAVTMGRSFIDDLDKHPARFVTVAELAEYWSVTTKTIYRHIDKGVLQVVKLPGGAIRIPTVEARRYGRPNNPAHDAGS